MLTLPLTAPLAAGSKTTVNDVLWPGVKVKGKARPLRLNPGPLAAAAEIVKLVPPLFDKVSVREVEVPTCTFPNARLAGFAVSFPCVTPVPDKGKFRVESDALEVNATLPLAPPGD
jgi:hypothetical protein